MLRRRLPYQALHSALLLGSRCETIGAAVPQANKGVPRPVPTMSRGRPPLVGVQSQRPTGAARAPAVVPAPEKILAPARHNPIGALLAEEDQKVLLARAQYCLFTLSFSATSGLFAVYCATTNEVLVFPEDQQWKCAMWIDEHIGTDFIAGLLFGSDSSDRIKAACELLTHKAEKRVVAGPDAWGIAFLAFKAQNEVVRGMELPTSAEHATFLLTRRAFDAQLLSPTVFDTASNAFLSSDVLDRAGAARSALLTWQMLYNVHLRFGTPGTKSTLNPIDQIVRRAVKAVNIFVVDINVRIGKGTIADGITMIVTIYDAQKRNQTIFSIRSLAEETVKLNGLTTLLYGEGSSSISLFIPTLQTKPSQLVAFARTCRPKSPFFIVELKSVAAHFQGRNMTANMTAGMDPKTTWSMLRTNCASVEVKKKDEATLDRFLVRGLTAMSNKLFADRLSKISPAIMTVASSIPDPQEETAALTSAREMERVAKENPVQSLATTTFLNKVNTNDADVVFGLQRWKSKIYENEERLAKEREVMKAHRRYLIVDLETTTVRRYKRIANPFTRENFVVLSGARDYKGNVFMPTRYFDRSVALRYDDAALCEKTYLVEKSSPRSLFLPPLDDYDVLVGHNFKFDLLQLWRDHELRAFLQRGGRIWDTMYAEYLLTGQEVRLGKGAGLEDVARSYGGQTAKLDAVKQAWQAGKETYEIPYATLVEYLHGDLENTELIFRKHLERAVAQSQMIICSERMNGLLCTTEMEYNGLKTNVDLALSQSAQVTAEIRTLRQKLVDALPKEIPPDCRQFFNWASNQHLIAYFFGGTLKLSTSAKESRALPGEKFVRHTLFLPPDAFPPENFPNGVFLRPPVAVLGPGDCSLVAGQPFKKGTKHFKSYLDAYMQQSNCRKSSSLLDTLIKEAVTVSRTDPDQRGETAQLANLLPNRHLFLFVAVSVNVDDEIEGIFVKNPISDESVTISGGDLAAKLEAFISAQVAAHTEMLVLTDEDLAASNASFATAQVTLFVRDACFSFTRQVFSDPALARYFSDHITPDAEVEFAKRYTINLADTVATLAYYKHHYANRSIGGGAPSGKASATSGTGAVTAGDPIIPPRALPHSPQGRKKKTPAADAFERMLRAEQTMRPEEWVSHYCDVFLDLGNRVLQNEAYAPSGSGSGKKKASATAAKKKKVSKTAATDVEQAEEDLPILLRPRRAFVGYYNSLPEKQRRRLALMTLAGNTVSTPHDCFTVACSHDDTVTVRITGALERYIPNKMEADKTRNLYRNQTTRQLKVNEDALSYFHKTHGDTVAATLLELRGLEKLVGTYYESTDGGTGMVSLVHPIDSCIHHELIHNKTSTGRLSSANPNCQNIPKEDKSNLRDMFISRFGEKGMCIEADYSQLEVVCLAVLADDEQMLEDLRSKVDFHCKRVAMMRPDLKYTDVLQRAKKNKEPEFVKLRQQAKIFSFQRQYGAGVKMISKSTGLTMDQVQMLIQKEQEVYRGVDIFNNMVALSANTLDPSLQNGARNVRGHQLYKGVFPVLTGSRYVFTESDLPESMLRRGQAMHKSTNFSPTHLKNYPVQGFAGEIVQVMLGRLWRHFVSKRNYNGLAVLTNTVHDCVWVDCHESVYRTVAQDVERIMTSVRPVMNELFPEMGITVDFPCDVVAGPHMGALEPILKETVV